MSTGTIMIITMSSIFVGFVCFVSLYAARVYEKPKAVLWALFAGAVVCVVLIPLFMAIFEAAYPGLVHK